MPVVIALLRAVNIGGHNKVPMGALRELCESLGLCNAQTYIQSGNVVFRTRSRDLVRLAGRLESAMEQSFRFHSAVMLRTLDELREVVARNPFTGRDGIEPAKLAVTFLAGAPEAEAPDRLAKLKTDPEEVHLDGRQMYIYFPNGMGRSKLQMAAIEKAVKVAGTARNWNTVTKLVTIAEALEVGR